MKKIEIGQCFGPAQCLTNVKWRPAFVMASRDNTMVLRAPVLEVESIMNVIYSLLIKIANKFICNT
jgi:hypothetical protein